MAVDGSLFGRGGEEPPEESDELDAKVDALFSEAVERQVAEQRTLNRLVEAATDRLDALESGLRALREASTTQGVAARAEVQDAVARLADDVRTRLQELADDVERVRRSSSEQAVRAVQVAESLQEAVSALATRLDGFETGLSVGDRDALAAVQAEVRAQLDRFRAEQLERAEAERARDDEARRAAGERLVERLRGELDGLRAQLAEVRAERDAAVAAVVAEVRATVEGADRGAARDTVERLADRLDALDVRTGHHADRQLEQLEVLADRVEALDAPLRADLAALAGRLDVLDAPLRADLAGLAERVAAFEPALRDDVAALAGRVGELGPELRDDLATLAARLDAVTPALREDLATLGDAIAGVRGRLDDGIAADARLEDAVREELAHLRDRFADRLDELRAATEALGPALEVAGRTAADDVRRALAEQTEHVAALLEATESSTDTLLAEQRAARDAVTGAVERSAAETATSLTGHWSEGLHALREAVLVRLEEADERGARAQRDARSAVEAALEAAVTRLSAEAETLRDVVSASRAEQAEALDGLRAALLADLDARLAGVEERSVGLEERLAGRLGGLADEVRSALVADREAADRAAEALRATLEERLAGVEGRSAALSEEVTSRLGGAAAELRTLAGTVDERMSAALDAIDRQLADARAELAGEVGRSAEAAGTRLAAAEDAFAAASGDVRTALAAATEELTAAVGDRLAAVEASVAGRVAELDRALDTRLSSAESQLRAVAEELVAVTGTLDDRIAAGLDEAAAAARDEARGASRTLRRAAERIDGLFEGLGGLETALVGYLEARDRRLEQERATVLAELVDRFAEGLSRRERRKLGGRLRAATEEVVPPPPPPQPEPVVPRPAPELRPGVLADLLAEEEPAVGAEIPEQPEPAVPAPEPEAPVGHVCPTCGFEARSAGGLASHRRVHR